MSNKNTKLVFPGILNVSELIGCVVLPEINSFECLDGRAHATSASVHARGFVTVTGVGSIPSLGKVIFYFVFIPRPICLSLLIEVCGSYTPLSQQKT